MQTTKVPCAYCGKLLDVAEIARKQHVSQDVVRSRPSHCNREHDQLRRQRDGIYSDMGKTEKPTVAVSNKQNPRRRKR